MRDRETGPDYAARVQALEDQGMTTSDAQACVDVDGDRKAPLYEAATIAPEEWGMKLQLETWAVVKGVPDRLVRKFEAAPGEITEELLFHLSSGAEWDYEVYGPTDTFIRVPSGLIRLVVQDAPANEPTNEREI